MLTSKLYYSGALLFVKLFLMISKKLFAARTLFNDLIFLI